MKKLAIIAISLLFFTKNVLASDLETLTKVYTLVQDESASGYTAGDIAGVTLEALTLMDKNFKVANQGKSLGVYYNARVTKSYSKPATDDIKGWVELSDKIINDAKKLSKIIKNKDFEIVDTIMIEAFKKFQDGSKYHSFLDVNGKRKQKRNISGIFYERELGNGILYTRISEFTLGTKEDVAASLRNNSDIKGLIIDLRGNEGGSLKGALSVAELFMDEGIIISTKGKTEEHSTFYVPSREEVIYQNNMVILVDEKTASSAEALAAGLQAQSRAILIGTKTFGKGSVQTVFELPNDSTLALTTAYFNTPAGDKIEGVGITPDICTFGIVNLANVEKLISDDKQHRKYCSRESRDNAEFDVDVAKILLTTP